MLGFLKKNSTDAPRAHVRVDVDPVTGAFELHVVQPFEPDEAEAVLDAALGRVRDLTEEARARSVEAHVREVGRSLGVMDKLARRARRWETEARNVVPTELFVGEAGRGAVKVTIDGELGFVSLGIEPDARGEAASALVVEALHDAESRARERWRECLAGALEKLPDDDKVELGLPPGRAPRALPEPATPRAAAPEPEADEDDEGPTTEHPHDGPMPDDDEDEESLAEAAAQAAAEVAARAGAAGGGPDGQGGDPAGLPASEGGAAEKDPAG